jgi:hypothetical protein
MSGEHNARDPGPQGRGRTLPLIPAQPVMSAEKCV